MKSLNELQNHIDEKRYNHAFNLVKTMLNEYPHNDRILKILYGITAQLRSKCIDLAVNKQDNTSTYLIHFDLLVKVNELTGQDIYGRFK